MFMNILFGIIIDTFADLRDKRNFINEDKKNKCFICSIDRVEFDKYPGGLERHAKEDHDLWNYVNFLASMRFKSSIDFNATESYIDLMINKFDITWVPLERAMCLGNDESNFK